MNLITFIKENLAHVAPILLCGAAGLAIIIDRARALYSTYAFKDSESFLEKVSGMVMSAKIAEAASYCDQHREKPVATVVKAALSRAHLPESSIQDGVQLSVQKCTQTLLKRTSFLATIANVATLLGLFGTIAGLIQSFDAVAHADAQQKSALLSAGIATAMNATMMGLAVAIPCMIAFSILSNRSNRMISELEETAVQVTDMLKQRYYASEFVESPLASSSGETQDEKETKVDSKKVTPIRRSA